MPEIEDYLKEFLRINIAKALIFVIIFISSVIMLFIAVKSGSGDQLIHLEGTEYYLFLFFYWPSVVFIMRYEPGSSMAGMCFFLGEIIVINAVWFYTLSCTIYAIANKINKKPRNPGHNDTKP